MTTQIGVDVFRDFAKMSGVELHPTDESTTVDAFEQRKGWNAAAYQLSL